MDPEIGNVGNSFRALENCTDLINKRKIASVVLIFTAVAISGVGAVWSVMLDCSESVPCSVLWMIRKILRIIYILTVANSFSI